MNVCFRDNDTDGQAVAIYRYMTLNALYPLVAAY